MPVLNFSFTKKKQNKSAQHKNHFTPNSNDLGIEVRAFVFAFPSN